MDSPLLPTHRHRTLSHHSNNNPIDDPSLLADLSIEDDDMGADDSFMPSSPIRSSSRLSQYSQLGVRAPNQPASSGSASSSRSASRTGFVPRRQVTIAAEDDKDDPSERPIERTGAGGKSTSKPRFSLFAPPRPPSADIPSSASGRGRSVSVDREQDDEREEEEEEDREGGGEEDGEDQTIHATAGPSRPSTQASSGDREDRLRESLYELRRMNEVFDGFLGALEASRGHNERLAVRVKQTSALLDEYTAFLGQAEHTQKLLSNPKWTGAHDDAAAIEAEHRAQIQAEQQRLREAEEAAEAAQRAQEEKEQKLAAAERAKEASRGGTAGRARGGTRGGVTRGRGSGIPTTTRPGSKTPTTGIRRPTAPSGTAGGSAGTGGSGTGTGTGKYGHVASSGYGPPGRKS